MEGTHCVACVETLHSDEQRRSENRFVAPVVKLQEKPRCRDVDGISSWMSCFHRFSLGLFRDVHERGEWTVENPGGPAHRHPRR